MQTSSLRRQMKNMVNNYTEAEIKVREATSNDHWGPPSSLMSEIADLTFNVVAFAEVMGMIWKRLNDHGKNWRHVYKALTLLDYLIKTGSERVAQECRENIHTIQTLRDFQYIDRDGRDQGINVREKAKQLVALLRDEEKLKRERSQALKTKTRMAGVTSSLSSGSLPPPYPGQRTSSAGVYGEDMRRCRSSPSSHSSSSSPRLAPDMEQARPATSGEEELQLQLALAMSREESEKVPLTGISHTHTHTHTEQTSCPYSTCTAFMDLVDVFAVSSDLPSGDSRWNNAAQQAAAQLGGTDPWDSLESIHSQPPYQREQQPMELSGNLFPELEAPLVNKTSSYFFSLLLFSHSLTVALCIPHTFNLRNLFFLLSDGDLFDEAMDGGQMNVNGRGEGSPELFDLSHLGESLAAPSPRTCRTPESFLGPTAASLVNLDSLIPVNPPAKTKNPFLSGLSAPSATNPFQTDQPKLTLNQMGSGSTSLAPHSTTLPYSASLPLPMSHQPASLPSSLTHPTQPGLDLPGNLPEPLLPFSSASTQGSQAAQSSQNPFL
uniref:Epsin 3a n=1 Tax=Seriola dumerili TaxID=41447 RepID=A0A3B4UM56_SERDU